MLAKRIIPCLDVNHGRVVKGKKFHNLQDVDDPVTLGKYYSESGADELVFYDITATHEGRETFVDTVRAIAEELTIPFTVGGGIRKADDFRTMLLAGADKVSVNSAAVMHPEIIRESAERFGNQCVVLSIDGKRNGKGGWDVFVEGGRKNTGLSVVDWARKGMELGAGEICMNSIDADGERMAMIWSSCASSQKSSLSPSSPPAARGRKKTSSKPSKQALMQHWLLPSSTSEKLRFPTSNTTSYRTE